MDLGGVFSDLVRLEIELWNAVDQRLRATHGLPLARFEPMQVIARASPCRVGDIADALSITVGGTSKIVDRLESLRLCERRPAPDDGRDRLRVGVEKLAVVRGGYGRCGKIGVAVFGERDVHGALFACMRTNN